MILAAGARLGPYEIVSALGAGGMGEVHRARDTRLDRVVAIKIIIGGDAERPFFGGVAWLGQRLVLGGSALLLAAFAAIGGFSIGGAYVPAAGLQLVATCLAAFFGSARLEPASADKPLQASADRSG